jgi:hypothetical protein
VSRKLRPAPTIRNISKQLDSDALVYNKIRSTMSST